VYSVWGAKGFGSGMLTSAKLVSFGNGFNLDTHKCQVGKLW
jgi:hypothetical protein